MVYEVDIPSTVRVEKYYVLRGIMSVMGAKKVVKEMELECEPTTVQIAQFLKDSGADFVSVVENYRMYNELPFA